MIGSFFDISQQLSGYSAQKTADRAIEKNAETVLDLQTVAHRLDALTLASQALWELLRERTGLTDHEILRRIEQIDLRDGHKDGKITPRPIVCPNCGKTLNSRHKRCIYCSATLVPSEVFNSL